MTEPWWSKDGQKQIERHNRFFFLLLMLTGIVVLGLAVIGFNDLIQR